MPLRKGKGVAVITTADVQGEYKFGAGRYWQMPNALDLIGAEVKRLGTKACVTGGETALALTRERLSSGLDAAEIPWVEERYSGPASAAKAAAVASVATEKGCDVIVGVGGGRALDLAKAAAALLGAPVITVPASAATCAAYAPLSVLYHENGAYDHCVWHEREVDAVLVDMEIQSAQPPRLMASGILDAMAKYLEISNGRAELNLQDVPIAMHSAHSFARYTYEALERYGYRAVQDLKEGRRTKPLEDTVFLNIALTGMISGITKGRGQTSVAHALYNAVRTHFYLESRNFLHGEIVAVGLLSQLFYNEDEARLPVLRDYMRRLGMPCSLEEIGIRPSERNLEVLYHDICQQQFMVQDEARLTRLKAALNLIR